MRLVQLYHKEHGRKVALVKEPKLQLIDDFKSVYELAQKAISKGVKLPVLIHEHISKIRLDYDSIYQGASDWQLLPSFDHPSDINQLMLTGTGLTHKASAENRNAMHEAASENELTDSMKMYLWGVKEGRPEKGEIGVQPEWFYKGNGTILKGHGAPLTIPPYANDGGEEPEIAGVYLIDSDGKPWRVGFTTCNEFSDHIMERKNYLYLAPSKIRNCAIGPELVITKDFDDIPGAVRIIRKTEIVWEQKIKTGEANMCHSLTNLEYHHFKYQNHRLAGQGHIHFFGADAFSFGENISLASGDVMEVQWEGMGRALQNTLIIDTNEERMPNIASLC